MRRTLFPALLAIFLAQPLSGQTVPAPTSYLGEHRVLSEREQAPIVSRWITQRFDTILPKLMSTLGPDYGPRVVSAELLAVGWLEAKLPEETEMYRHAMRISHQIIGEAFSNKVIVPGVTTTQDVVWYMRQRVAELGLGGGHRWFHPTVSVQRKGGVPATGPSTGAVRREAEGVVIERGDLLHTDFGFMYMGFATDTQHKAYVLRHGEDEAPAGLREGLRQANRLQDLTLEHARVGRTGNEALRAALAAARAEGLDPMIYSHPIGYHGHGAGPPIGMTDYQDGVPVQGEYPFYANTWHSIELAVRTPVPEWDGEEVRFAPEEEAALLEHGWSWIAGKQTEFYLIR